MIMNGFQVLFAFAVLASAAIPPYNPRPFDGVLRKRQDTTSLTASSHGLVIDLGYEQYRGVANDSIGLNHYLGIRYAAPPTGQARWQPPRAPAVNRDQVLSGDTLPQRCPQSPNAPLYTPDYNFTGNEDCLFLSVYAPQNKTNLPVLVYIHGGGYGAGQGNLDLSSIITANGNSFVGVAIQYRLGAFGFLSSDEVMRYGVVNAGILDQTFALQWVQNYIGLFGGNASQVTIAGESAGGGSVMLQAMAFGGHLGDSLFSNILAASPFLPQQYSYADFVPSQSYYAFASAAGCFGNPPLPQGNLSTSIFNCLLSADSTTLQNASAAISASGRFGTWAFLPVTDGVFIQQLPSQQLLSKQVNGVNMLVGNNANEGVGFTPQDIITEDDFVAFVQNTFPLFTDSDVQKVLRYYPSTNASVDASTPLFATLGNTSAATALNESTFGTGQQQRADNLYAETTFVCPSYWMAEAFASGSSSPGNYGPARKAYKYQYSVVGAEHAADLRAFVGFPSPNQGPAFVKAAETIWGNFVTRNDPSISPDLVNGNSSTGASSFSGKFPVFSIAEPYQVNLNETGGMLKSEMAVAGVGNGNVSEYVGGGLGNAFDVVDAYSWEGGRGARCDFWRSVAKLVPE